jgi:hypothetical protein
MAVNTSKSFHKDHDDVIQPAIHALCVDKASTINVMKCIVHPGTCSSLLQSVLVYFKVRWLMLKVIIRWPGTLTKNYSLMAMFTEALNCILS